MPHSANAAQLPSPSRPARSPRHSRFRRQRHARPRAYRVAPNRREAPLSPAYNARPHNRPSPTTPTTAAQELSDIASFFTNLVPALRPPRPLPRSRSEHINLHRHAQHRNVPRSVSFADQLTSATQSAPSQSAPPHSQKLLHSQDGLLSPCTSADEHDAVPSPPSELSIINDHHPEHNKPQQEQNAIKRVNSLLLDNVLKLCVQAFQPHPN